MDCARSHISCRRISSVAVSAPEPSPLIARGTSSTWAFRSNSIDTGAALLASPCAREGPHTLSFSSQARPFLAQAVHGCSGCTYSHWEYQPPLQRSMDTFWCHARHCLHRSFPDRPCSLFPRTGSTLRRRVRILIPLWQVCNSSYLLGDSGTLTREGTIASRPSDAKSCPSKPPSTNVRSPESRTKLRDCIPVCCNVIKTPINRLK